MKKICKNCNKEFDSKTVIDNIERNLSNRKYCLECSPFGDLRNKIVPNQRRSIIWQIPSDEFKDMVINSKSITDFLSKLNMVNKGRNNQTFLKRVQEENINIDHMRLYAKQNITRSIPLEEYLVFGKEISGSILKKKIIKAGLMEDICSVCGQLPAWNGQHLSLELDHINGNRLDNRIENLRIVCPHCHSQTPNFRGRANKGKKFYKESIKYYCQDCGNQIFDNRAIRCVKCSAIFQRKASRPDIETLLEDVSSLGYCGTGRKYGVSDNAIRKWIKHDSNKSK